MYYVETLDLQRMASTQPRGSVFTSDGGGGAAADQPFLSADLAANSLPVCEPAARICRSVGVRYVCEGLCREAARGPNKGSDWTGGVPCTALWPKYPLIYLSSVYY